MNEAQHKANNKYRREHYKCVSFYVDKDGEYAALMEQVKAAGYHSLKAYIVDAINEKAGRNLLRVPNPPIVHRF